jgi:hypothetical protein
MSHITLPRVRRIALIALGVAIAALLVATFYANRDSAQATHSPANKVWVSAETKEFMAKSVNPAQPGENPDQVILARGRTKFSNPTDLRISVSSECALWTNTATTGDDSSEARARVEVWVTLDGIVVPVSEVNPDPDPVAAVAGTDANDPDRQAARGRVVFCNRAAKMTTENIETVRRNNPITGQPETVPDSDDEDDIVIRSYNRTRSANGFNWGAMNVGRQYDLPYNGNNIVDIVVHARLAASLADTDTTDNNGVDSPAALAAVGKRTLFVEPVKMANDAAF